MMEIQKKKSRSEEQRETRKNMKWMAKKTSPQHSLAAWTGKIAQRIVPRTTPLTPIENIHQYSIYECSIAVPQQTHNSLWTSKTNFKSKRSELLLTPGQLSGASAGRSSAGTWFFASGAFSGVFSATPLTPLTPLMPLMPLLASGAGSVATALGDFSRFVAQKSALATHTPAAAPTVKVKTWEPDMAPLTDQGTFEITKPWKPQNGVVAC